MRVVPIGRVYRELEIWALTIGRVYRELGIWGLTIWRGIDCEFKIRGQPLGEGRTGVRDTGAPDKGCPNYGCSRYGGVLIVSSGRALQDFAIRGLPIRDVCHELAIQLLALGSFVLGLSVRIRHGACPHRGCGGSHGNEF